MNRPGTALQRATDLLNLVDEYAREGIGDGCECDRCATGDVLALRHAVEAMTRTAQQYPGCADAMEGYAARMCEALDLVERDT